MSERKEVMWCTDCGARFTQEEIKGWGCPKCGCTGIPCATEKDVAVEVNWHELHILTVWAENWARKMEEDGSEGDLDPSHTIQAIARRLHLQHPSLGHLTLSGELAALPSDLAAKGIEVGNVETNIARPKLFQVNGPGAVGHTSALSSKNGVSQ